MRDPKRIRTIMAILTTMWETYPEMRLFQFLGFLHTQLSARLKRDALFYVEDDVMLETLKEMVKKW
jgi:uncharacterized protein YihD (DUF1040 family)